jgi:hypothetical protein
MHYLFVRGERRAPPSKTKEKANMSKEIFNMILKSKDGDYAFQAQVLAAMKPFGW